MLLLTLTLGGCESEGEPTSPGQPAVAATLALGTGLTAWQTLAEGDPLELATDEGWLRLGDRVVFDIAGPELVVGSAVCLVVVASSPSWKSEDRRCVTIVDELPGP